MKPPRRYIEDFYGGKGCDYKVREVYPPEPSSSACDFDPRESKDCDFDPSKHEACDFGPNTLSEDIKNVSVQLHKHNSKEG